MNEPTPDPDALRAELGLDAQTTAPEPATKEPPPQGKKRAGYTRNKGRGQSKAKRRMVKASRRRNRKDR